VDYTVKALFLAVLLPPTADRRMPVSGAGRVQSVDPADDETTALLGPIAQRKLDARWDLECAKVNDYLHSLTGYDLSELTTADATLRCMKLAANASGEHPALYPALMKLYRLHTNDSSRKTPQPIQGTE